MMHPDNAESHKKFKKIRKSTESKKHVLETFPHLYESPFPVFKEPREIGCFSVNEKREFQNDRSQLRHYAPPANKKNCSFDLRRGYSSMIKKNESVKSYLDNLLLWIINNKEKLINFHKRKENPIDRKSEKFERLNIDFVCWRGLLTKLLCIPYENREDLLLAVIFFRGTYYMCEYDSDSKVLQKNSTTPEQEEMCAWGFKFEQYVTADSHLDVPDPSVPVNTNSEFGSIVCTQLGSHSLMFGAEVDCENPNSKENNRYVELKTSRIIVSRKQNENFCRYKLIKWWAQSFVLGIRHIVCGFRDDNGVVRQVEDFNVAKIPSIVQENLKFPWKPNVCFNFLTDFLKFVRTNITEEDRRCVYLFRWMPGSQMSVERRKNDKTFNFLPEWYTEWTDWDT